MKSRWTIRIAIGSSWISDVCVESIVVVLDEPSVHDSLGPADSHGSLVQNLVDSMSHSRFSS